jgi:hypothetical protein
LRGWVGYFRYENSAQLFDTITLHALRRLAGLGLIDLNGTTVTPPPNRSRRRELSASG